LQQLPVSPSLAQQAFTRLQIHASTARFASASFSFPRVLSRIKYSAVGAARQQTRPFAAPPPILINRRFEINLAPPKGVDGVD